MTPDRIKGFADQLIEAGADAPFLDAEQNLFWHVPRWVVEAYAATRYERADVTHALAAVVIGEHDAKLLRSNPKLMIWTMVRAWQARLGELERKVRNLPAVAA
jgi:hypothetical protein